MAVKHQIWFFLAAVFVLALTVVYRASPGPVNPPAGALPPLEFYDKSEKRVSLDDFRGRVLLVNLWATWCTPCVAEMPSLERLQQQFKPDQFHVVALSTDTSSMKEITAFLHKNNITGLDVYWDKDRQVPLKWKYRGLPTSYLIDREGVMIKRYDGAAEWDKGPILEAIKEQVLK